MNYNTLFQTINNDNKIKKDVGFPVSHLLFLGYYVDLKGSS